MPQDAGQQSSADKTAGDVDPCSAFFITRKEPVMTNELEEARRIISETDKKIASLYETRMEAVRRVAAWKKERGLPVLD